MRKGKLVSIRRRREDRQRKHAGGAAWLVRLTGGALGILLLSVAVFALAGVGAAVGVWAYYTRDLPDPEEIQVVEQEFETIRFWDSSGQVLIYEKTSPLGDRIWLTIDQIPEAVKWATISLEDRDFYTNPGINIEGLGRAFVSNLRGREIQGGSSLTQQLVKNVLIDPEERYERSYSRKIKEVIMALAITRAYSKDQILEWYLNLNFYGHFAYGIESAAQVYFGKSIRELNLAEIAMLAPVPQYPGLNPIDNWEWAKRRQELTLDAMVATGYLTAEQAEVAKEAELIVQEGGVAERFDVIAPHFALYAADQLASLLEPDVVAKGGLDVYTTIDLELQAQAEEAARKRVRELTGQNRDVNNAAVISIRPRTGEILAMVGSLDYWDDEIDGKVNVAVAQRQPGSSFKPFTYVTALSQGYTAAHMILDVRTCPNPNDPSWCPENYPDSVGNRPYHGPQRLRLALARSYNIPAVRMMKAVGIGNVIKTAHAMGITTLRKDLDYYGLALTLGGGEVKLIDMVYAFSVFANGGVMYGVPISEDVAEMGYRELDPVAIKRIDDHDGETIWVYEQPEERRILDEKLAYLMNDILSDNSARAWAFGVDNKLVLPDRPVAAKTGTTDNWNDCWTIGYTPQVATGVWMGNTDNSPMLRVPGSYGAAYVWNDVMQSAHDGLPVETFVRPPGITERQVCSVSGLLPGEHCPTVVTEKFIAGTEPLVTCDIHRSFSINRETGKLATPNTPPELVEERVYAIYPPEADDWVREAKVPQPPTEYDDYAVDRSAEDVAILSPGMFGYVREMVEISGNARNNVRYWRLDVGRGLDPQEWLQIGGDHPYEVSGALMEYWDVRELDGLYTLRLSVVGHDDSIRQDVIQVTVDNVPPAMELNHPEPGMVFVKEEDEWVNVQATVGDNVSLDRVDFYVDGDIYATSTVPPYNKPWTIAMSDTVPVLREGAVGVTLPITQPDGTVTERYYLSNTLWATRTITNEDGTLGEERYPAVRVLYDPELDQTSMWYDGGMGIIADTHGYTETHLFHVVAVDAAGNENESSKVRVYVVHKEEPEEEAALPRVVARWLGQVQHTVIPAVVDAPPGHTVLAMGGLDPGKRGGR
ncbi:MAG: transglycosylase domain-containing protein [Anaerolineae bacterium]|nr:transglycosylase domain-containing protein [Anaerolineae bacterium]